MNNRHMSVKEQEGELYYMAGNYTNDDVIDRLIVNGDTVFILKDGTPMNDANRPPDEILLEIAQSFMMRKLCKRFIDVLKNAIDNGSKDIADAFSAGVLAILDTQKMSDCISSFIEDLKTAQALMEKLSDLEPFINIELRRNSYTIDDFSEIVKNHTFSHLRNILADPHSELSTLMKAAQCIKDKTMDLTAKDPRIIPYPLDKVSSNVFNFPQFNGHIAATFDMTKKQKPDVKVAYSIDFDSLPEGAEITKQLRPYDKLVYTAICAIFDAGNSVMTTTKIHHVMGNSGEPNTCQLERINKSISKMAGAWIKLVTKIEQKAPVANWPRFDYESSLLPMERTTARVNGIIIDSAIRLHREPPLMSFAKEWKQVTTINPELLQCPISQTDENLLIQDYLIRRISREKHKKKGCFRIKLNKLYERANIDTPVKKNRAPAKIRKCLSYYQEKGFIIRYSVEEDGITIYLKRR